MYILSWYSQQGIAAEFSQKKKKKEYRRKKSLRTVGLNNNIFYMRYIFFSIRLSNFLKHFKEEDGIQTPKISNPRLRLIPFFASIANVCETELTAVR